MERRTMTMPPLVVYRSADAEGALGACLNTPLTDAEVDALFEDHVE
jgi:hypothetical protein